MKNTIYSDIGIAKKEPPSIVKLLLLSVVYAIAILLIFKLTGIIDILIETRERINFNKSQGIDNRPFEKSPEEIQKRKLRKEFERVRAKLDRTPEEQKFYDQMEGKMQILYGIQPLSKQSPESLISQESEQPDETQPVSALEVLN